MPVAAPKLTLTAKERESLQASAQYFDMKLKSNLDLGALTKERPVSLKKSFTPRGTPLKSWKDVQSPYPAAGAADRHTLHLELQTDIPCSWSCRQTYPAAGAADSHTLQLELRADSHTLQLELQADSHTLQLELRADSHTLQLSCGQTAIPYSWSCGQTDIPYSWSCGQTDIPYSWNCGQTDISCSWSCRQTDIPCYPLCQSQPTHVKTWPLQCRQGQNTQSSCRRSPLSP
ncbi:unnamed protein product [Oncorhynchus mykiss]|uniref:Uncharacterized protein n=1 Tax=Oncorhynchus mykiss TaxID=8022 RepID=A0A060Y135_ONCMY|nr:unnamed protein product [Oncorhynchus mykiss]